MKSFPAHWRTTKLIDCVSEKPQYGANASAVDFDTQLPRYLRITDIREDGSLSDYGIKSLDWKFADRNLLQNGDLVLARSGATAGKSFLFRGDAPTAFEAIK